jgi:hypothetical protein
MSSRLERRFLIIGWVAIAALAVLIVRAWLDYRADRPPSAAPRAAAPAATTAAAAAPRAGVQPAPFLPPAGRASLVLRAARGDCWISVRRGTAGGGVLFEGVVKAGRSVSVAAPRLWVRMGAPLNVDATLAGRRVTLPPDTLDVVVTARGVRPAA